MSLPVTVPFTFGNATTTQSLSSLDTNFTTITNSVNGLTNGASQINVASISATGTANATTYLRGDGAWATVTGGGGSNGTVTSINATSTNGFSFTGGPVTTSGTLTLSVPAPGTSGNVLTSNGTVWSSSSGAYPLTSSTVNAGGANPFPSTAGPTSVDFTSIPTWVKRITVMFSGVSTSGTSNIQIQIGSGSVTTSGYVSAAGYAGSTNSAGSGTITSGHGIDGLNSTAAWVRYGSCRIENITGNAWVFSHSLGLLSSGAPYFIGGGGISPALSGALDRIRITTVSGTDLFDAGSINILYE